MADVFRVLVISLGGFIAGAGAIVLRDRARYYREQRLPTAVQAMWVLMLVNVLAMTFVAAALIERWEEPLSWRFFFGLFLFSMKGLFFWLMHRAEVEQERRHLFGE